MAPYGYSDKGRQSRPHGSPSAVYGDAEENFPVKTQAWPKAVKSQGLMQTIAQLRYPWLGWAFVYTVVLFVFFIYRCTALRALISMYASPKDGTPGVLIGVLTLGFLEDFVCATYFACALWLFDSSKAAISRYFQPTCKTRVAQVGGRISTFVVSWLLFVALVAPVVADSAKNRYCTLNSTTDSTTDKHQDPSPAEDSELDPTHVLSSRSTPRKVKNDGEDAVVLEATESSEMETLKTSDSDDNDSLESQNSSYEESHRQYFKRSVVVLNTTLNELFKHGLQPHERNTTINAKAFIDSTTEKYTLFGHDTLYRLTTGFQGDLAFDVNVSDQDPPNVLVIVIESFRYHDSHYLVGDKDPSNLFKGSNITVTPTFDKWAKRCIGLRNYWSSWRTSRSVESLMFGQLPYDSVTKSGMTGGQRDTKLSGLPQLFQAKGYETFFTTGCLTDYDNWDAFLPAHGFDTVWSRNEMKKLAESDLGIKHSDWDGPEHRALNWGVHDDLSFQLLGDLMVNKTKAQKSRMATGEAKKPLFLNHYTISSHVDYKQRPKWYANADKPDFSALYEGQKYANNIKNYLEMRYFTDMEFGKFMDRMAEAGILNDTIVVISGDHGQGPEFGNDVPEDRNVSATRVTGAIVAEGRLGDAVGMVMDDATEQYDMLNTLADITGVPEGGFEQDGVSVTQAKDQVWGTDRVK
ncbi:hypothetical protein PC119_g14932 [Phytophthora cactorum]|nr:hypothetical protein PC119_g14932 [Phytophthora cactorum]